jgi:predicted nuclease of predicted toxin-antitoxin system
MSLKVLVDMNLSAEWVALLARDGWETVHWSEMGDPRADDTTIMCWALANGYTVFTHDLDFGTALALTSASGPSVLQVRGKNVLPEHMGPLVLATLQQYEGELTAGALVVVEASRSRIRVLPILRVQ